MLKLHAGVSKKVGLPGPSAIGGHGLMAVMNASPSTSNSETAMGRTAPDQGESRYEVQPVLPFTAPTRRVEARSTIACGISTVFSAGSSPTQAALSIARA